MNEDMNQLTLSYELLYLLQWLIEHEPEGLKALIAESLKHGLKDQIKSIRPSNENEAPEDIQNSIIDFFGMMELLLHEASNEQTFQQMMEKKLMPAIDHIDTTQCSDEVVQLSIEHATNQFDNSPEKNPQELLYKELLRCWQPKKKTATN